MAFTGRPFDADTGLQWNLNRWYDASTGRWLSEDPIGFTSGDANLYRYVGNLSTFALDPHGTVLTEYQVRQAYKAMWGEDDPLWQSFFGAYNSFEMADVWGDHKFVERASGRYRIYIEEDLTDPLLAASYLREEILRVLMRDPRMADELRKYAYAHEQGHAGEFDAAAAQKTIVDQQLKEVQRLAEQVQLCLEIGVSIAFEGADWVFTIHDLSQGRVEAVVGFLPLIPSKAGCAVRKLLRIGDDVALDLAEEGMQVLRRMGVDPNKTDELIGLLEQRKALASNMRAAGMKRPPGIDVHAHHVVAKGASYGSVARARAILAKHGIDANNAVNGVWLAVEQDQRLHTRRYYDAVLKRLERVTSQQELVWELDRIRKQLAAGTFPH